MSDKQTWTKEELAEIFAEQERVTVTFTKADGSERTMVCTTNMELVPEDKRPKGTSTRPVSETNYVAWSIIDKGWRSFKIESLISVI